MKIAVCVKYIPVLTQIKFDYERKTIVREGTPSEISPFDVLGLVRAVEMKSEPDDEVVVISMGPPNTREGLLECLALGADRAVLLTDRALAGSDTLATARALALVLASEEPDLIICGRNSMDAETGQVGPEIAELMGIPHISNVRKLEWRSGGGIWAERVVDEGHQVIESPLPALVCATEGIAPEMYAGPEELEEAQEKPLQELNCSDLPADVSQLGADGSPTWVQDIRLVEPARLGMVIEAETPAEAAGKTAGLLRERLRELELAENNGAQGNMGPRFPGQREKSIWVVAENSQGRLWRVTLEMLGKARELTSFTESEVAAVLLGPANDGVGKELAAWGADRVMFIDGPSVGAACSGGAASALAAAIEADRPYAVLFASTADGRDLASRVAARLGLGLTGDAIDLEVDEEGRLVQLKPALGGNVVAPILSKTLPNMVTLRPGLLTSRGPGPGSDGRDRSGRSAGVLRAGHHGRGGALRRGPGCGGVDAGASRLGSGDGHWRAGESCGDPEVGAVHRCDAGDIQEHCARGLAAAPYPGRHQRPDDCAQGLRGGGIAGRVQPHRWGPESGSDPGDKPEQTGGDIQGRGLRDRGELDGVPSAAGGGVEARAGGSGPVREGSVGRWEQMLIALCKDES